MAAITPERVAAMQRLVNDPLWPENSRDELHVALRDLLGAYEAATQWRDMASAPKVQYGPLFLAWLDTERYALVRWREDKQRWWEDDMGAVTPTHFLPLPAPPVQETKA